MKYILLIFILLTTVGSAYAWDNNDRDYRKEITVSHINVSGSDLINYPAFLNITKTDGMQADYDDLIFYDASGNLMAAELEKGYTDYALVWINISTLSTSGTSFWMYYGNTICSDSWDVEGVWNHSYAMVQHLNESPANGVAGHIDSTNNDNDGTPEGFGGVPGSTTDTEGIMDGANDFDGANDYVDCGGDTSLQINANSSVSSWINFSGGAGLEIIVANTASAGYNGFYFAVHQEDLRMQYSNGVSSYALAKTDATIPSGWAHVAGNYDGNKIELYINGILQSLEIDAAGSGSYTSVDTLTIGARDSGLESFFTGTIDEVRISNITRTRDWIKQDYEIVINQTSVVMFGDEEVSNKFIQEASYFHIEMVGGLTNFRDSMGKYLVWGILFFAIGLAFTLFAKIKYTLIGSK